MIYFDGFSSDKYIIVISNPPKNEVYTHRGKLVHRSAALNDKSNHHPYKKTSE